MREKDRYLLLEWRKKKEGMNFGEVKSLIAREFARAHGEAGVAALGPRFRVFSFASNRGLCIRIRKESRALMTASVKTLRPSLHLVHVAGSATQATRAAKSKFNTTDEGDMGWII
ncbi:hypothetical protein BASA81_000726 [Batrachochytrium salamandrivorans]|nr:hypothetical protein BASA81_000726 [Batrachochytrium salamandrivorans]